MLSSCICCAEILHYIFAHFELNNIRYIQCNIISQVQFTILVFAVWGTSASAWRRVAADTALLPADTLRPAFFQSPQTIDICLNLFSFRIQLQSCNNSFFFFFSVVPSFLWQSNTKFNCYRGGHAFSSRLLSFYWPSYGVSTVVEVGSHSHDLHSFLWQKSIIQRAIFDVDSWCIIMRNKMTIVNSNYLREVDWYQDSDINETSILG